MSEHRDDAAAARAPSPEASADLPARNIAALTHAAVAARGDAPYVTFYDDATGERTELGYRSFLNWVAKTANLLVEEFDTGPGDRVGVLVGNHWTTAVATFACWHVGACVVPVAPDQPVPVIADALASAGAGVAFVREELVPALDDLRAGCGVGPVVVVGRGLGARLTGGLGGARDTLGYGEEVLAFADDYDDPDVGHGESALLVAPSDTGSPAWVRLTQGNLLAAAGALRAWGLGDDDRALVGGPAQSVNGLVVAQLAQMAAGGSVVLDADVDPGRVWDRIERERVTVGQLAAPQLARLGEPPAGVPDRFRGMLASHHAPADVVARVEGVTGRPVFAGYAAAEATGAATLVPADVDEATLRWIHAAGGIGVGVPTREADVAILAEDGTPVDRGVSGNLALRGRIVMAGYEDHPDGDGAAFAHGRLSTGAQARVLDGPDGRPHVFLVARR
jgi:uncharacterized protein (TIGR03089 family)